MVVIDCTVIGASPPTGTSPTVICFVDLAGDERAGDVHGDLDQPIGWVMSRYRPVNISIASTAITPIANGISRSTSAK